MYRGIDGRLRDRPAAAGERLGAGLSGLVIDRDVGKNRHGGAPAEALLVIDASDSTRRRCRLPRASPTHAMPVILRLGIHIVAIVGRR